MEITQVKPKKKKPVKLFPDLGEFGDEIVSEYFTVSEVSDADYRSKCSGVYIIKVKEYYKVGFTSNFANRLDSFKNANPFPIELVFFLKSEFPQEVEKQLHEVLKDKRVFREWFLLDNSDIVKAVNYVQSVWKELLKQQNANN